MTRLGAVTYHRGFDRLGERRRPLATSRLRSCLYVLGLLMSSSLPALGQLQSSSHLRAESGVSAPGAALVAVAPTLDCGSLVKLDFGDLPDAPTSIVSATLATRTGGGAKKGAPALRYTRARAQLLEKLHIDGHGSLGEAKPHPAWTVVAVNGY